MKTSGQLQLGALKSVRVLPLFLALLFGATTGLVSAQTTAATAAPQSRAQVKMERDEFIRTHHYDTESENWVLRVGIEPPMGVKTRVEIKGERDTFMRNNRFDTVSQAWIPLKATPRDLNAMTREQVRAETLAFVRTHTWNVESESWDDKVVSKKK
jgi:hypothetical protein